MTAKEAHEALLKRDAELDDFDFDFVRGCGRVMVRDREGSVFDINSAFAEKHGEWWFVFSEHSGCHCFHKEDVYIHEYDIKFNWRK